LSQAISLNIDLLLPWYSTIDEDRSFKKIVGGFLLAFLLFSIIVAFYPVPEKTREQKETLPPQLARVILEKKELPPPPVPKPKPLEKKPELKKPEPKKPEPKKIELKKSEPKKVEPVVTQQQKIDVAKQEATAQIVQFQDSLAQLRDLTIDTAANNNLTRGAADAVATQRNVIANVAKTSSGGIRISKQSVNTGGAALSGTKNTKVKSSLADSQRKSNSQRKTTTTSDGRKLAERSAESIRKVIDINKAALDTTYQRALRKNPVLEGAFIVRLIIEPNGQVSSVTIIDSELEDDALEKKLLARIRLFNFGTASVAQTPVKYTFNFLPQ
jgi:outer membrane biosynthesis protein TonB